MSDYYLCVALLVIISCGVDASNFTRVVHGFSL